MFWPTPSLHITKLRAVSHEGDTQSCVGTKRPPPRGWRAHARPHFHFRFVFSTSSQSLKIQLNTFKVLLKYLNIFLKYFKIPPLGGPPKGGSMSAGAKPSQRRLPSGSDTETVQAGAGSLSFCCFRSCCPFCGGVSFDRQPTCMVGEVCT